MFPFLIIDALISKCEKWTRKFSTKERCLSCSRFSAAGENKGDCKAVCAVVEIAGPTTDLLTSRLPPTRANGEVFVVGLLQSCCRSACDPVNLDNTPPRPVFCLAGLRSREDK